MRTLTVNDILNAMEKNGYRKAKKVFISFRSSAPPMSKVAYDYNDVLPDTENVYAACAFGQAALNLGIPHRKFFNAFPNAHVIVELNDYTSKSIKQIVKEYRERYPEHLETAIQIND